MLAKIAPPTNDFHALARYLVRGKPGTTPHPNRVTWIATQNLPTEEPELAATYMAATAAASRRVQRAAYHLMIAWHANEAPEAEAMRDVAFKTLMLAGLQDHEALIMGHGDKVHPHLHILLNRVHPGTGKAWSTGHDYKRFDAIMRHLSDAYGFRYVPGHAFDPELTDRLPRKPDSPATYAAKRGARTGRLQWSRASSRQFGAELSEELGKAPTAEELAEEIAKRGLRLEAKGKGYVVGNEVSYSKLSNLGLAVNGKYAVLELVPAFDAARASSGMLRLLDEVDIVRFLAQYGLADREDVLRALMERRKVREARLQSQPLAIVPRARVGHYRSSTYLQPLSAESARNGLAPKLSKTISQQTTQSHR